MENVQWFATPWWVNLLLFIPVLAAVQFRRSGLQVSWQRLVLLALFAMAFGFVESSVVFYLRAATGLLPGYQGTLTDVQRSAQTYQPAMSLDQFPRSLSTVEFFREAATMIMLVTLAFIAAPKTRERWALFLWTFAAWDISYYAGLWLTVRWPASLRDVDVLFLIPVPWVAQIWFPILISALTMLAVISARRLSSDEIR